MRVFRQRLLNACVLFRFGIEGRTVDVIVLIPDHCFSIYFIADMVRINSSFFGQHLTIRSENKLQHTCFVINIPTKYDLSK